MRTEQQLLSEAAMCRVLGLPFSLTKEERMRSFGDVVLQSKDQNDLDTARAERFLAGLPLSKEDTKKAKAFIKQHGRTTTLG
jgi:hypothetical protein